MIKELRKDYRFRFESNEKGIALFDLVFAFIGAYLIEQLFNLSQKLTVVDQNDRLTLYYLLVIPIGILTHIIFNVDSFLIQELIKPGMNYYKVLMSLLILWILRFLVCSEH